MCNLINTHTHTHTHTSIIDPPWEDQCEWHRMTRITGPDCAVKRYLINTHTHTHTHTYMIPPWEDQREWHIMTRMTGPDCAVMCNLINTQTHTHTHRYTGTQYNVVKWRSSVRFTRQDCLGYFVHHMTHDTCSLHTNSISGSGKREAHKNWSLVKPEKAAPVTGTTLRTTDPVPTDSRQGTPSVRNRVTRLIRD